VPDCRVGAVTIKAWRFMVIAIPTAFSSLTLQERPPVVPQARLRRDGAVGRCPAVLRALIPGERFVAETTAWLERLDAVAPAC